MQQNTNCVEECKCLLHKLYLLPFSQPLEPKSVKQIEQLHARAKGPRLVSILLFPTKKKKVSGHLLQFLFFPLAPSCSPFPLILRKYKTK